MAAFPAPIRRDCHEVTERLCRVGLSRLNADDGVLLPSLVLPPPLLQPVQYVLLLFSSPELPLRWSLIQGCPFFFRRAGP